MKKRFDKLLLCGLIICSLAVPAGFADGDAPIETEAPATQVPATPAPTAEPTQVPTQEPTSEPTLEPTSEPTPEPTSEPTLEPTSEPTLEPTSEPTLEPTSEPTLDPPSEPTLEPTSEPTLEPTSEPTLEPTSEPTLEPTSEPTLEPTSEPTQEPTSEPTLEPTSEPTLEPTSEPTLEPTAEPSLSPSPSPSATPMPLPGSIDGLVNITPESEAQQENGVWRIRLSMPDSPFSFTWTVSADAQNHLLYMQDPQGNISFLTETTQTRIDLSSADYASGQYTLYVGAVLADGCVTWGCASFELAGQQSGFPGGAGGFPGGMGSFPSGGGRPSGGSGAAAALPEAEQGFRITPGKALTSKHASGSMDTSSYRHANVESSDEPISTLVLDSTQAEITLDDGTSTFMASVEEEKLVLTPESGGKTWQLSALAMNTLYASGVNRVEFHLDSTIRSLPTQMEFSGSVYASLRAQGYVSKDVTLRIDGQGLYAHIAGKNYSINESGELVPLEG